MAKGVKTDKQLYYLREFIFPNGKRLFNISKHDNFRLNDFEKSTVKVLFEKFGTDNVQMNIVSSSTNIDRVKKHFEYCVEVYDTTNPENGYNKNSKSNYGVGHINASNDVRKKVSERQKRPIVAFNLDHSLVGYFDSIMSAAEDLKLDSSGISKCCRGVSNNCGGYIFRYFDDVVSYYWEN